MSDSDEDSLPNVFTFQNDNTTISAKGSNVNNTDINVLNYRYNALTSSIHNMPVNFERQRYGGSNFDQRSMYYRRETSPMSLRSMPDYRPPGFNHSMYQNRMGTQRSMYNGRGGSPISVRSIDSTASVSAADIVFAFKNVKFNKYDMRIIKDAYNKLIKTRQRKRIEKRRNLKLFKATRRKSGEDSGEQGSDSSVSSDDCRSVRTTICKENIPGIRHIRDTSHFSRDMREGVNPTGDVPHFGHNMKEMSMFTDRTQNIKQNTFRNLLSISSGVTNGYSKDRFLNSTTPQNLNISALKVQNTSVMTQKERFKKGFLLPSQRFNKTIPGQAQANNNKSKKIKIVGKNRVDVTTPAVVGSDSDQEEIFHGFSNQTDIQNIQRKRLLETEDLCYSSKKRNTSDSPKKVKCSVVPESNCTNVPNVKSNDFIFTKPKIPVKKGYTKKECVPEKLLAKSRVPPIAEEINFNFEKNNTESSEKENIKDIEDTQSDTMHSNSDLSMRPSFIKRKLFTQKLDIAELKNVSSDSLLANSPQNIYSASMRERNKTRKLVTSQSCLSREVTGEDSNVLDLIHKIVPPDQINSTNIASQADPGNKKSKDANNDNKWDVTAVIANCDNQDISDTYTDEEIFHVNHDKSKEECKKPMQNLKKVSQCKIVVQKLPAQILNKIGKKTNSNEVQRINKSGKDTNKKSVTDCVKSFWDTDFESDMEFNVTSSRNNNVKKQEEAVLQKQNSGGENKQNQSIKKISKGTILTVRTVHHSLLNNSVKSHGSPTKNKNKQVELVGSNTVVQEKDDIKVGKTNKDTNLASQTGKKKETIKENVPVNRNNEEPGRKQKTKQCVDCNNDKPIITSQNTKKNTKLTKVNDQSDIKKNITKKSAKHLNLPVKKTVQSKDSKRSEPKQADTSDKLIIISSGQNNKTLKESVNNVRIQPKRKSKDKSFIQSSGLKSSCTKGPNKAPKTKSTKEFHSINTSISNTSSIITRSKDKLSFNTSQNDYSSMNLSNISDRSIRLRQRVQRNIN